MENITLVIYLLFVIGLLFGLSLYELFGIKTIGIFAIPLLAIYTLLSWKILPLLVVAIVITYLFGLMLQEVFLFYGRRLYLIMASCSFLFTAILLNMFIDTDTIFASIIPSIFAYGLLVNGRDLKELVVYTCGSIIVLILLGAIILRGLGMNVFNMGV